MVAARARPPRDATPSPRGAYPRSATAHARRARGLTATSSADAGEGRSDEPIEQEGAVRRRAPDGARGGDEQLRRQADAQDLVSHFDDLPGDGGPHDRGARWPQARAG